MTVLTPFSGGTSMVARWRTTMPTAAKIAASRANNTAKPGPTKPDTPLHRGDADDDSQLTSTVEGFGGDVLTGG
jgi:hypothetical protein